MKIDIDKYEKHASRFLGKLGQKKIIDNINFSDDNKTISFTYIEQPLKISIFLTISINSKIIKRYPIDKKNSNLDLIPTEIENKLILRKENKLSKQEAEAIPLIKENHTNTLRLDLDFSCEGSLSRLWSCTGNISFSQQKSELIGEIKDFVPIVLKNEEHIETIVDNAITQFITDQLTLDSSKYKEIYEKQKNQILLEFRKKIYDDITNEDKTIQELVNNNIFISTIELKLITDILEDFSKDKETNLLDLYKKNIEHSKIDGQDNIDFIDVLKTKLLNLLFQKVKEQIINAADLKQKSVSEANQTIFQKHLEIHQSTIQDKFLETALTDIKDNKKITDSNSQLYKDILHKIEETILSADNIDDFINKQDTHFQSYKEKLFSKALEILKKEKQEDLKEEFTETIFKQIIDEIKIDEYYQKIIQQKETETKFFEIKNKINEIKEKFTNIVLLSIKSQWLNEYLLRKYNSFDEQFKYFKNIFTIIINFVYNLLKQPDFFNKTTKGMDFSHIAKLIVKVAAENINIPDYIKEINDQQKAKIIQSIVKPEKVVENFIQQSNKYISNQSIKLEPQILQIFDQMNQFIKNLETHNNKIFQTFIREMIVLCLLFKQATYEDHKDYFKDGLIEIFYIFLENKTNISNPQVMLESFIEKKVLFFLEDTIDKSGVKGNQDIKSSLLKTFGLKTIPIDTGRTTFNRQYHKEEAKDNKKNYPRNVILKVSENGYEIEWSGKIIRKAGVIVNYR